MTKDFGQGIEMPALKNKQGGPIDLMRPGNGTPWEDRGSTGAVSAYFKTVIRSMFSPGLLMDHIRRPETTNDANLFAGVSIAMWVVGVLVWNAWLYFHVIPSPSSDVDIADPTYFWVTAVLQAVLVAAGFVAFLVFGPRIYRSLGGTELRGATPSLIQNCFSYSLGPSILAVVPVYGWALAGIWIVFDLMVAGRRRFYIKGAGAIINALIIVFIAMVIAVPAYFVLHWLWGSWFDMSGVLAKPPVVPAGPGGPVHHGTIPTKPGMS